MNKDCNILFKTGDLVWIPQDVFIIKMDQEATVCLKKLDNPIMALFVDDADVRLIRKGICCKVFWKNAEWLVSRKYLYLVNNNNNNNKEGNDFNKIY